MMQKRKASRRTTRWMAIIAVILMTSPDAAQAARKLVRRSLPGGVPAASPAQTQSRGDAAVEAGVARLLSAANAGLPLSALGREKGGGAYLSRSAGGYVKSLVAPAGRTWPISRPGTDTSAEGLALAFLRENRAALGWARRGASFSAGVSRRSANRSYVRLEQRFAGLPVFGATALVQVEDSGGVSFVLSDIARDDAHMHESDFATEPSIADGSAVSKALGVTASPSRSSLEAEAPVLMVYEPSVIGSAGPSRLVWHVRVRSGAGDVNEVVLVDASTGDLAFRHSDIKTVKNRSIYDAANTPGSLGTLVRSEGGAASGIVDADLAYGYFGDTYDFYFTRFGRDSFDGSGATLVGRVRYCEASGSCPYPNAYWNGSEMRFGANYASADDVVAHELTHAVTERESNLIYWGESGAINEALSDIFGEFVDLTNSGGADGPSVRWLMGEDLPLPGGPIRSMADPTLYGDPDRRFSLNWYTGAEDNRGVHFNSGVANKLAFLLTDGGSFNGQTVTGQGISQVAGLFYEAQVNLLVPASDYFDLYAALRQAAKNKSWTGAARDTLEAASRAVEINLPGNAVTLFSDGFEGAFPGSWQVVDQGGAAGTGLGTQWGKSTYRKASGSASAYCAAGGSSPSTGTPPVYKPLMDTWMVYGPFSLSSTTQAWAEFDLFLDVEYPLDEVFWGVSTDGVNFDGYPISPGPDGFTVGQSSYPGWSHELFNFKEIPGILGQPQVWLTFQFISDYMVESEGAYVDNVVIQRAPSAAPFGSFDYPASGASGLSGSVALQGWALDDYRVTKIEIYRNPVGGETPGPNGKIYVGDAVQVPGLRPDVETAHPGYPYAYKAGWTYNLRSYFLPSSGNGTFTFFAYGYDADGLSSQLGASRTLTFTNTPAALATPTVTAPLAGQVVNVSGVNFSWTAVGAADRYDLRLWKRPSAEVVYAGSVLGAASTSNLVSLPDGAYQFSVRACNGGVADAQCGSFASVPFTVTQAGPSGAPTITFPTNGANLTTSTQTLQWTAVTPNPALPGMTYEVLLRNIQEETTALQIKVPAPTTSTIFTMSSSNHYELKVRACQASCGPWSVPVAFSVTLPAVPTGTPTISGCTVSGGNSLTCTWGAVSRADAYQVHVVQAPPAGPGGGALTVAAKQVSATTVTLPVPAGAASVFIAACNGDGCGPYSTAGITAAGPNPSQANIGTPMAGTVVSGPGVLFTWNRVPGDNGSNTWYRLYVQDLSRQAAALDVYTRSNFHSAYFNAEGARYDALVLSNPGLPSQVPGPAQGFNVSGASTTAPTLVSPAHNSTVGSGNIQLGWSPVPGATLYQYFVAVLGQGQGTVTGVTPGLVVQVPLTGAGAGTIYSGIVRACPSGATCQPGSDTGWGPWSNAPGGPGVTNFTVTP